MYLFSISYRYRRKDPLFLIITLTHSAWPVLLWFQLNCCLAWSTMWREGKKNCTFWNCDRYLFIYICPSNLWYFISFLIYLFIFFFMSNYSIDYISLIEFRHPILAVFVDEEKSELLSMWQCGIQRGLDEHSVKRLYNKTYHSHERVTLW